MTDTGHYEVRQGDTISTIARRFKVGQTQLIEANDGSTILRVGKHFNIADIRKAKSVKVAYSIGHEDI